MPVSARKYRFYKDKAIIIAILAGDQNPGEDYSDELLFLELFEEVAG